MSCGSDAVISFSACSISRVSAIGIDVGLLLDRDDDGGLAHVAGFAALHLGRELDGSDLAQKHRPAIDLGDDHAAKVVQARGSADIPDQVFARMLVGEATAGVDAELGQRLFDLLIGDAEAAQRRRIRRNAILADLAADRDDLGDARDREQARANREVGDFADLHRGRLVAGHRDQHDLPHDRVDRPDLRAPRSAATAP